MKKVLTLMGALSVAGSAFAYDYDWALSDLGGKNKDWTNNSLSVATDLTYIGSSSSQWNDVVKGVVSSVKGSETNNCFQFNVEVGDIITVHAITIGGNTGKAYVKQGGVETNADIDNSGSVVLTVDAAKTAGLVSVYADPNVAITKITVVSAKYRDVVAKLAEARAAIDTEKEGIAKYVTDYPNFYSAVTRQISEKVSNEILRIEEKLAEDAAVDGVSGGSGSGDGLIAELANLETNVLPGIITAANQAVNDYTTNFLGSTQYTAANNALTEAYNTVDNISGWGTSHPYSMYQTDGYGYGKYLKAEGLDTYMDTYAKKYFEDACKAAKDELDNFPWLQDDGVTYGSYPASDHTSVVAETVDRVKNIIDRFVYERDNAQKFEDLKTLANTVANDITSTGLDKPAGFDTLKGNIEDLYNLLNKADNKHVYNQSEINGAVFETPYTTYNTNLGTAMSTLTASAKTVQDAECAKVQEDLNKYSAQITELYTGQPTTQAKYEQLFAKLQVRLDAIKNLTTYAQRVTAYATVMEELGNIDGEILQIWGDSQGEKVAEIVAQNQTKYNTLTNDITSALNQYAEMVNRINGYKAIPGIGDDQDAIDEINAQLANVFDYAYDIETTKKDAATAYDKVKDGSGSFDYDTYKAEVDAALASIVTATQAARGEANQAAYDYLTTDRYSVGTLAYADRMLTNASNKYSAGGAKADSYLASQAVTKIGGLRTSYYTPAQTKINSHWNSTDPKQCDIADYVTVIANDLNPIYGKLTEIDNQVDAYDASSAKITKLKIRWSVAKANVDPEYTAVLVAKLNTINEDVNALETKLQGYGFDASKHQSEIDDEVARLKNELWIVENYKIYLANEAALIVVNEAIDDVKAELTAAKAEVAQLVSPEVVNEYTGKLDAVSFAGVENSRDSHYASHDLNDETVKSQIVNVDLKAISDEIAQIVEDAKAADKAAQEVPGDVNGDKALDAFDYEIIEEFVLTGASEDEADDIKDMRAKSDLNNDGKVDTRDLNEFFKLYRNK